MRSNLFFTVLFSASALAMAGCGDSGNTTVNVNRTAANSNTAVMANNNGNSNAGGSSITNSISNAVGSVTTSSPEEFMNEAALGGLAEVEMGKLASTKATNPEVKKFAHMMVQEHTKANAELKALATKKGKTLPEAVDSSHKSTMDAMNAKTGADFDREYVEAMLDAHEDDVAAFEKQSQNSTDPDVKAFAAKTLPTLKKHLDAIKALEAKLQ